MTATGCTISNVDEWYEKWSLSKEGLKLKAEDAKEAIKELEALVESYCDLDVKKKAIKTQDWQIAKRQT